MAVTSMGGLMAVPDVAPRTPRRSVGRGGGRAGGGEELGGIRAVKHFLQRAAVQGSPTMLTAVTGEYVRGGKVTGEVDPRNETNASLSRLMIGSEPPELHHEERAPGAVALEVKDLRLAKLDQFGVTLDGMALQLRAGEVDPRGRPASRWLDGALAGGDTAGLTLRRAVDAAKDQSYVLAISGREGLARALFPLGDAPSKAQVRTEAESRGLPVASKPDSYDICFVADGDTRARLVGLLQLSQVETVTGVL